MTGPGADAPAVCAVIQTMEPSVTTAPVVHCAAGSVPNGCPSMTVSCIPDTHADYHVTTGGVTGPGGDPPVIAIGRDTALESRCTIIVAVAADSLAA